MSGTFANAHYDNEQIDNASSIAKETIKHIQANPDEYLVSSGGTDSIWLGTIEIGGKQAQVQLVITSDLNRFIDEE